MANRTRNGENHPEQSERREHRGSNSAEGSFLGPGSLTTTALVLGGIALLQPELLTGLALGAGVALLSGRMPKLGVSTFRPALKAAVQAGYSAMEVVAHAAEEIQDMIAETRSEHEQQPPAKEEPHIMH
jgi:uncharacterized membrane protein